MPIMLAYLSILLFSSLPFTRASHINPRKGHDTRMSRWRSHHMDGWEEHPHWNPHATTGNATFEQYIDHKNPGLGTFEQSYYWSSEHWNSSGPVVVFTPGEGNASAYTSYLTTNRSTGRLAQEIGAAVIVLEHRYWGNSSPFANLTTENLQYLTLENSISDLTHFAKTVRLPFDHQRTSSPEKAPWIQMGGSYSGALAAWTSSTQPGTYWAYYASSAPVQAITDYWQYFVPIQQGMPKNCSSDVSLVIDHIDAILLNGTEAQITSLKTRFGLQDLKHNDDFAAALENGPWLWQSNQFYRSGGFFEFCDALENVSANSTSLPGADGVGLETALAGYANWFKNTFLPGYCAGYGYEDWSDDHSVACLDTYNTSSPQFTDMTLSNQFDRQWVWMTCNEPFGYFQTGAPKGRPSIVSRLSTADYWTRQCPLMFPGIYDGQVKTTAQLNAYTKGWDNQSLRLLYVNGDYDPWREASVSSDFRPQGKLQSSTGNPIVIVPGGFHTSDLVTQNGEVNSGAQKAIDEALSIMKSWVKDFRPNKQRFVA